MTRPGTAVRRAGAAAATALGLVLTGAVLVPADARPAGMVFQLKFEGRGAVHDGTVFENTAGKGRVQVELEDGRFKRVRGKPGKALRYPVEGGYGLLEGADRKAWDPGRRDFRFGVTVKIPRAQATRHMNAFQKGYHLQSGGQWKLQIDAGFPSCVVRGDVNRVLVRGTESVTDGRWHRLVCRRTEADGVRLFVDGSLAASSTNATGKVSNNAPIRLGAKKLGPGGVEQFHGRLDAPFLFVAPPTS